MPAIPKEYITPEAYLEMERQAETKSEYYKGEVFAMAGATKEHNKIVAAIVGELYNYFKGKNCSVFPSDIRVHNEENGFYTYPDVTVACGEEKYLDNEFDTLLNPIIILEVLSNTTESYDRGIKFKLYRSIPSLKHYVLVSSTEVNAEVYTRNEKDEWILTTVNDKAASIYVSAIPFPLPLKAVYSQVKF